MEIRVQRYAVPFFVITMQQQLLMLLPLLMLLLVFCCRQKQGLIYKCFHFSKLCNKEGVAHAVQLQLLLQPLPVPAQARLHAPHAELQLPLAGRAALVGRVRPSLARKINALADGAEVDGLEYVAVELTRSLALKRQLQAAEHVSQTLHSETNGSVPHIAPLGGRYWVVVDVNHGVQVTRDNACDLHQPFKVEVVAGSRGRSAAVLDDFGAQIGGLDGAPTLNPIS